MIHYRWRFPALRFASTVLVLLGFFAVAAPFASAQSCTGTGFVVEPSGYIVTCAHVVESAARIDVRLAGRDYAARVIASDDDVDLALIKITAKGLPVLPLGDSDRVQLAEDLRAVGYPLASVLGSSIKVSRGSLSGFVQKDSGRMLQIDVPINPGNSGGPLVNDQGEVVGVASAKLAGVAISNVSFAVPSNLVRKMLTAEDVEYETRGSRGQLQGPELARRVTPAVALIEVTLDRRPPAGGRRPEPSQPSPPEQATETPAPQPSPERLEVPIGPAREKAEALVEEAFGADLAEAKTDDQKTGVAREMLKVAWEEKDMALRFALLDRARRTAIEAGDLEAATDALEGLVSGFKLDAIQARMAVLLAIAPNTTDRETWQEIADMAVEMLDETVARDDFTSAGTLYQAAKEAAQRARNNAMVRDLVAREAPLRQLRDMHASLAQFRAKLKDNPADPKANLMVGKYLCFVKKDWEAGLPLLAIGNDEALKKVAEAELDDPASTDGVLAIADQWWVIAEKEHEAFQKAIRLRALELYNDIVGELSGLKKRPVEQLLNQHADLLEGTGPDDRPTVTSSGSGLRSSNPTVRLIGHTAEQIKQNQTVKTQEHGFKLGGTPFECVPEEGGLLVGFDISLGVFNNVQAIRPIFLTYKGYVRGPIYGPPSAASLTITAKKGYAVGKVAISPKLGIDGFRLQCMKIDGGTLDPDDSYLLPWCGKGTPTQTVGGDGRPIVGIFGRYDGHRLLTLGLIVAEKGP